MRNIVFTNEFLEYYNSLPEKVKKKYDYVMQIMRSQYVVSEIMSKIDIEKLKGLSNVDDLFNQKYGEEGSASRLEFEAKAKAWYYAELLKDERKRQKITQQELADMIGKKREYISSLEKGKTDMQLSTFLQLSYALGLRFSLVLG